MEAVFRSAIEDVRREGRTVLLSSHILSEVEALADHVSIIRAGRTVETGALSDMRHLSRTSVDAVLADAPPVALLEGIAGIAGPHHRRLPASPSPSTRPGSARCSPGSASTASRA